jgi:undecaprenyl-phosphate 4-deoxy-4-formamido-L-arabinose transferase
LVAKLREGSDVVYGTAGRRTEGAVRRIASRAARWVLRRAMGVEVTFSSFRAFRTELRDGFADFGGPYVSIDVLLSWSTVRFASIPVVQAPRREGRSSYSTGRLASLALTMLTGFSTRPLRLASLVGFTFTLLGIVSLVYVLVRFFISGRVAPGFAFLASIVAIFAGAQLFALGIIGEYLARVHMRVLDPPTYAIREELP